MSTDPLVLLTDIFLGTDMCGMSEGAPLGRDVIGGAFLARLL
jgi:hypothetical protein